MTEREVFLKKSFIENPISAADYAITMLCDASSPLILRLQPFWFAPEIAIFLEKEMFWQAPNGIRFGSLMDFTYTPYEQDSVESPVPYVGYLLGFGSNMHKECYNSVTVTFKTEEEKLRHVNLIQSAVNDLVQAAMSITPSRSPWFAWDIDKNRVENQ